MGKDILLKGLLLFPLVFLVIFLIYPLVNILLFSFSASNPASEILSALFSGQKLFINSFFQAALSTVLAFLVGFPAAYIIANYDFPGKKFVRALSLVPFVMPSILVALSFVIILGYNGWINNFLMSFFNLSDPPVKALYSIYGIVLAHAFYNFPIFMRFVGSAWERTSEKMHDAARTLGTSRTQLFMKITLPQLMPSIMVSSAIVFIYCFMSFAIVLTLGGIQFSTVEVGIYYALSRNLDFAAAAAMTIMQFVFLLAMIFIYSRFYKSFASLNFEKKTAIHSSGKFNRYAEVLIIKSDSFAGKKSLGLGKPMHFLMASYLVLLVAMVLLPIAALIFFSASTPTPLRGFEALLSTKTSLAGTTPLIAVFNSLLFAVLAALLCTSIAILLAYRHKNTAMGLSSSLIVSSMAISGITLAMAYLLSFGSGIWQLIVVGHSLLALPFAYKIVSNSLNSIPMQQLDAASSLGADEFRIAGKIELPQIKGAIITAACFAFAVSLGELAITLMLYDGKFATMPVYIMRYISTYNIFAATAMGLLLIAAAGASFYVIEKIGNNAVI